MFTECDHFFLEVGLEDEQEFWKLCNVRLIGQYGQRLDVLEEEYLQDLTSLDAFDRERIQRELARRDRIRDEIASLPEDQRVAARLSESERQSRWEALRRVHRDRWSTRTGATTQPNATADKRKSRWRRLRVLLASA
ncbi:hypothetical protein ASPCAL04316 [Aspergillus calidoustus]|uniref:Uncharacterized protein n=1 Tax=Aspergillus calidoustus TaxID=454130 RepID=A0A0U5FWS6_ASPCI|nr:hypothetical protein ASPCAL04316 [Aspergillus calidoustus]